MSDRAKLALDVALDRTTLDDYVDSTGLSYRTATRHMSLGMTELANLIRREEARGPSVGGATRVGID